MDKNSILLEVENIFIKFFKTPNLKLSVSTTAKDIKGWDSLTHIALIANVEKKFNVEFEFMEVMDLENIGALVDLIALKSKA